MPGACLTTVKSADAYAIRVAAQSPRAESDDAPSTNAAAHF